MISTQSLGSPAGVGGYEAPRRLCLDAKGKVVEANDPTRVSLLVSKGQFLPRHRAQALGLLEEETEATDEAPAGGTPTGTAPEGEAQTQADAKAITPTNKAHTPDATK